MDNTENNTPKIDTEELQKSVSQTMKVSDLPEEIQKGLAEALTGSIRTEDVQAAIARTQDGAVQEMAAEEVPQPAPEKESAAADEKAPADSVKDAVKTAKDDVEAMKQETEEAVEKAKTDLRSVIEELEKKTKEAEDAHVRAAAAAGVEEPGVFSGGEMKTANDLGEEDPEAVKEKEIEKKQSEMAARVAEAVKEGKKETAEAKKSGFLHRGVPFLLLLIAAIVCALLYFTLRAGHEDVAETAPTSEEAALSEIPEGTLTIPTNAPLEKNADNDLNAFFRNYYDALNNYNEDVLVKSNPALEKTDLVRMHAVSEYVTGYPVVDVYTKPGPNPDTYVAYVYTRVKYDGYAKEVPGMQTMYMVKDADGNFYIDNNSDDEDVNTYIRRISIQEDVLALNKQVEEEYNSLLQENNNLESFMTDLNAAIEVKIGNLLAIESGHSIGEVEVTESTSEEGAEVVEEGTEATGEEETEGTEAENPEGETEEGTETATEESAPAHAKARAKEAVRVRKTAEDDADFYGVVYPGHDLDVVAEDGEWLTVTFEGETGYVKAQYFELHD